MSNNHSRCDKIYLRHNLFSYLNKLQTMLGDGSTKNCNNRENARKIFVSGIVCTKIRSFPGRRRKGKEVFNWWRLLCRASMIEFLFTHVFHLGNEIFIRFLRVRPSNFLSQREKGCRGWGIHFEEFCGSSVVKEDEVFWK